MRLVTAALLLSCTVLLTACGSNTPTKTIDSMAKIENAQEAKQYYTKRTVELIEELERMAPPDEESSSDYNVIKQDSDCEIVEQTIDGDNAKVTMKITSPSQTSPMTYTMKMKKEDGAWKIDQEQELESAVKLLKSVNENMSGMGDAMKALGNMFGG